MILAQPIEMPTGAVATFWRPRCATLNFEARSLVVQIGVWLDEAAYDAGKQPLVDFPETFSGADMDATLGGPVDLSALVLTLLGARQLYAQPSPPADGGGA